MTKAKTMKEIERIEKYRTIIQDAFKLLEKEKTYTQKAIVGKLNYLKIKISTSSLHNALKGKTIKLQTAKILMDGMIEIVETELLYNFYQEKSSFEKSNPNKKTAIIPQIDHGLSSAGLIFHHKGRLPIKQKTDFIKSAEYEHCEVGVRLNTFTSYFTSRNDSEYKKYIEELLQKGVNIKMYLLNPDFNAARFYFEDRAKVEGFEEEASAPETIKKIIKKLKKIQHSFSEKNYSGQFQIFTYKHIPYNHFLIVDGNKRNGKIVVSNYLYGVHRAKCPVIQISKAADLDLYKMYWTSFNALTKNAKAI